MLIVDCDSKHKIVLDYFGDDEDCTKLHEELKRNSSTIYYFAWTDNAQVDAKMVNCEIMPLAITHENVYLNPVAFAKAGKNELRALCNARPQYYREEVIENLVSSHINPALDEKAAPIALADVIENISLSLFDAKDIQVIPSIHDGEVNLKIGDKDLVGKVKFGRGIGDDSVSINSSLYLELKEKDDADVVPYQAEFLEPGLIAITLSNGGVISFTTADFVQAGEWDTTEADRAYDLFCVWATNVAFAKGRHPLRRSDFNKKVIATVLDYARKIGNAFVVFFDEHNELEDRFKLGDYPITVIMPYYIKPEEEDKESVLYGRPPRSTIKCFAENNH